MKYRLPDNTVELSLSRLCALAVGDSPMGELPSTYIYEREKTLFPSGYERNVSLSALLEGDGLRYELTGVADGVFCVGREWTVNVVRMADAREMRAVKQTWKTYAQLLGFLLAEREGCEAVTVRLVLVSREDGSIKTSLKKLSRESLHGFTSTLISLLAFYVNQTVERERERRPSADGVPFPYPEIREGQEEMIRGVMNAIRREKRLFVCAPTGIGKTVSALYPAVRAFGSGLCDKIFYLTAKTSTSLEAYHAAGKLFEAGAHLRTVVLGAKEAACPSKRGCGKYCNTRDCARLRDAKERTQKALEELLGKQNGFYSSVIREVADRHNLCPYELSLDLSELCDIIICDYNYLFDPMVHLKRYFDGERSFGDYIFLLDEAHNLVDRARAMFTVTLSQKRLLALGEAIPEKNASLFAILSPLLGAMEGTREMCRENRQAQADGSTAGYYIGQTRAEELDKAILTFAQKANEWLRAHREDEMYDALNELFRETQRYTAILSRYDEKFITYIEETAEDLKVSLICMDPTEVVGERLDMGRASVLFSATLTPTEYFCDVLGGTKQALSVTLPSPFDPEGLCVAVADYLSVRMEDREKNSARYATVIAATVSAKPGNYIAYFPSYSCLESVLTVFRKKYPKVEVVVQRQGMGMREKEEFLSAFKEDAGHLRVGFCVLSGAFSEGVDLPGSRLIGAIVFGVGLPGLSNERNIIREYFDQNEGQGYEYAYTYPGMNHVLQAVGRVIRREEDRGVAVLVDDRYAEPKYRALYPAHWSAVQYAGNASSLAEIMRRFWEKWE